METLLIVAFLFTAIFFGYFLGVESGREESARDIEADEWFKTADPAAARHAALICRRQLDG